VVRWKGYLNWVLSQYVEKEIKKDIRYILWISLYQIAFMKKAHYHIVNETVEYSKKEKGKKVGNFVNAVLRKFVMEKNNLPRPPLGSDLKNEVHSSLFTIHSLSITYSFPEWLVERWFRRFGQNETERLLSVLNKTPDFVIRINLKSITRDKVIHHFESKGIKTGNGIFLESALHIDKLASVMKDELFKKGLISIQDEASQLVGWSIQPQDGSSILDACAGLGTKTRQIKEYSHNSLVIAMDKEIKRLRLLKNRTNLVKGDVLNCPFRKESFNIILLDAPCSSLGIIRKHPEIKWRRKEKDIINFGNYQLNLLKTLWDSLKTGGYLIYSVCSFEPEETLNVIERFKKEKKFILENPLPFLFNKKYFLSLPHETGMDGFFIARLKKL